MQQQLQDSEFKDELLGFARSRPEDTYVGANVIGRDPSPFLHYIFIDKGSDDGLVYGMPVVTAQGLVGRIDAVIANAARIQLITDPASSVNVQLSATRTEAILTGSLTGDVILDMVPQDADLKPGAVILTSALGGNFPVEYPGGAGGQRAQARNRAFPISLGTTFGKLFRFACRACCDRFYLGRSFPAGSGRRQPRNPCQHYWEFLSF